MPTDPFTLLGLPRTFEIEAGDLQRRYLARASQIHPDLAGGESESAVRAAELNDARAALADNERRAILLLGLLGGPSAERDRTLPPGFLAEIMEIREQLDEAVRSKNSEEIGRWTRWTRDQREAMTAQVAAVFRALDVAAPKPEDLAAIRQRLNAWRYIERLKEQLEG